LEDRTLPSVDLWNAFPGLSTSAQPPDTTGAAGPDYVMEAINLSAAWYDKGSGAQIFSRPLSSIFNSAGLSGVLNLSDPVAMYDEFTGQFVVGALDYNTSSQSRFDLAISNDENPNDGFYGQRYDMNDGTGGFDFADYPKAGYNQDAYVFSFNMFPHLSSFNHVNTLAVDKSSLTGYRVAVPGATSNFTLAPSVMHNSNPGDPMWLVETGGSTSIRVVEMTNILSSSPSFQTFSIGVPSFSAEPAPFQPGDTSRGTIPTFDTRIINASYNSGLLVAGHSIGAGGRAQARWYEIDVVDYGTPTLVQEGNVDQGAGVYTYFPSLDINSEGDIGMTFMESSTSEYLSMYVAGQSIYNADYGTGVMEPPALAIAGTARYVSQYNRIGDYSGTSLDPADGYSFWSFNQYGRGTGTTAVAYFSVDPDSTGPAAANNNGRRILPPLSAGVAEPTDQPAIVPLVGFAPLTLATPVTAVAPVARSASEALPPQAIPLHAQMAAEIAASIRQDNALVGTLVPTSAPAPVAIVGDLGFEDLLNL
jgi:hypothetical protein